LRIQQSWNERVIAPTSFASWPLRHFRESNPRDDARPFTTNARLETYEWRCRQVECAERGGEANTEGLEISLSLSMSVPAVAVRPGVLVRRGFTVRHLIVRGEFVVPGALIVRSRLVVVGVLAMGGGLVVPDVLAVRWKL